MFVPLTKCMSLDVCVFVTVSTCMQVCMCACKLKFRETKRGNSCGPLLCEKGEVWVGRGGSSKKVKK